MAGLPSTTIAFPGPLPPLELIASRMEDRGGLAVGARSEQGAMRVHFVCRPQDETEIRPCPDNAGRMEVTDWSLQGGSLYRLACDVLVELGGTCTVDWGDPLRLPITEASLERERRNISVASMLVVLMLALVATGVAAGVVFGLWRVVESTI